MLTLYYDKSQKKNFKAAFQNINHDTIKSKNHNKYYVLTIDLSNLNLLECYFTNTIRTRLLSSIKRFFNNSNLTKNSSNLKQSSNSLLNQLKKQDEEHKILRSFLDFIHKHTRQKLVVYINEGTTLNVETSDFTRPITLIYRVLFNHLTPDGCIHKIVASDIKSDCRNFINQKYDVFKNITQTPEVNRIFRFNENKVCQLIQQYHLASSAAETNQIMNDIIKFLKNIHKGFSNHFFKPKATLFYLDYISLFKKPPEHFDETLIIKSAFSKSTFNYADPEVMKPILLSLLKNKTLAYIGQIGLYNGVSLGAMSTNSVLGHLYKDELIVHPANHRYRLMPADEEAAQQLLLLYSAL